MGTFRQGFIAVLLVAMPLADPAVADDRSDCYVGDQARLTDPDYFDVGVQACTRLIASSSGKPLAAAYSARGAWKTKQQKYDEAIADLDRALSIDPAKVEYYDYSADVWLAKGDLDRAIGIYDRAIRMDPSYAAAHYSRGRAYEKKGDVARARRDYRAALATPKTRANDSTGIQQWAHQVAAARLKEMDANKTPGR